MIARSTFPIRRPYLLGKAVDCPSSIPWALIACHAERARRNQGQTLERLAERGGLFPGEVVAILEDRSYEGMPDREAIRRLRELAAGGEIPAAVLQDMIALVVGLDEIPTLHELEQLSPEERAYAERWAALEHLRASDNLHVRRIERPAWLRNGASP